MACMWQPGQLPPFAALFDERIPGWREDNSSLRYALNLSKRDVWLAHLKAKQSLIEKVNELTGIGMKSDMFTIGFARRAAEYKRADLLFWDIGRLTEIASGAGGLQLIYAGKAHPQICRGKQVIRRIP